jgi:hypothetical protein
VSKGFCEETSNSLLHRLLLVDRQLTELLEY